MHATIKILMQFYMISYPDGNVNTFVQIFYKGICRCIYLMKIL